MFFNFLRLIIGLVLVIYFMIKQIEIRKEMEKKTGFEVQWTFDLHVLNEKYRKKFGRDATYFKMYLYGMGLIVSGALLVFPSFAWLLIRFLPNK